MPSERIQQRIDSLLGEAELAIGDGGRVRVSALMREVVASSGEFTLKGRPPAAFKGLDGEHLMYAVGWA